MFKVYWNSLRLTVGATFLNNVLGLLLAVGLNRAMPWGLRYLLRTSIFFPGHDHDRFPGRCLALPPHPGPGASSTSLSARSVWTQYPGSAAQRGLSSPP